MFCKTCGNLLKEWDTVCSVCGAPVVNVPEAPAPAPSPGFAPYPAAASQPAYATPSANAAPAYAAPSQPAYSAPSASAAPAYAAPSNDPSQTSLFSGDSQTPVPPSQFDFSWESDVFHNQDYRGETEEIDFKWNVGADSVDLTPSEAATATAVEQTAPAAPEPPKQPDNIFAGDTFHLRTGEREDAEFASVKKNEAFQELLDEEFEKIRERQYEIDDERNRINELAPKASEPAPSAHVTGETARAAAEARIREYLRKADTEMFKALQEQSGAPQTAPETPAQFESEPQARFEPEPPALSEDAIPERLDSYDPYSGDIFAQPDEQDIHARALAFKHADGDIAWEREHEDYDPAVSAIAPEKDEAETPSYLDGLPAHVAKPDAAPVAKPDTAPTAKPDVAPVAKPDTAPTAKPDAAPVAKPDTAPTAKPDVVPVAKLDTAPTAKPDVVPVAKPDVAPVAKPAFIDPIIEHLPESTDPLAGAAEANAPKPKPDTAPIGGGIFVTDFVNPFAADAEAVPAEAATAAAPAVAEEPKPAGDSIFDTGFANPFGEAAFTAPAGTATAHAQPAPPTIADSIFAPEAGDIFADAAAPLTQGATQAPFPATKPTQVQPIAPEPAPTPILDFESLPTAAPKPPAKPVAAAPKPAPVSEPPIKAAPITEAPSTPISSSPMSSRKHAQDIINKPVVFPFDEAPDKGKGAQDDIFKIPDSKTPEAHKPDIEGAAAKTGVAAKPQAPGKPGSQPDGKTDETDKKKPNKAVVIIVDILIIIAVIAVACWVVHRFAPGTGAAELIDKGLLKVTEFFGGSDPGAGADAAANANDPNFMMPISDGAALVSSQINKNYLIADVAYDPAAKWEDGRAYNIEGAAAAKPISDDFWKDSPLGKLRYDESAVAAVIQFDSDLIEYINNRTGKVLSRIVERSAAEKNLAEIVASVKQLSIERLGIGSIRKNGDDLYVWTKETITETKAGSPVQREVSRLYRLTPGDTEYRVSDFEDLA